jgi:hypothetical protein
MAWLRSGIVMAGVNYGENTTPYPPPVEVEERGIKKPGGERRRQVTSANHFTAVVEYTLEDGVILFSQTFKFVELAKAVRAVASIAFAPGIAASITKSVAVKAPPTSVKLTVKKVPAHPVELTVQV